jgi:hypothetical protein
MQELNLKWIFVVCIEICDIEKDLDPPNEKKRNLSFELHVTREVAIKLTRLK